MKSLKTMAKRIWHLADALPDWLFRTVRRCPNCAADLGLNGATSAIVHHECICGRREHTELTRSTCACGAVSTWTINDACVDWWKREHEVPN